MRTSSVRKVATPRPTGTAITMAMIDVTSVPYIAAAAPKFSVTGFQAWDVRKLKPYACIAGQEPWTSETMTPPRMISTTTAAARVT